MSYLLVGVGATLADELSHFRYIGPVRDLHPDTGVGSRSRRTRLWADGSAAWDLLCDRTAPGNSSFLDEINAWLTPEDRLDTGYRLEDHSYVELSANAPLVQAGRLLKGLGVSFSDRLSMDLLDHWIREQFSLFSDHIDEPELLAAVIDDIKADEPINPTTSRHRDRIHASVLRHATSSYSDAHDHARQLAPLVTAGILHKAARVQPRYREFLAVGEILEGRTRPEIQRLLSNAATAPLHTRLRLVTTSTDLRLSTSDIGVGISQILPVVVAALDPNRPAFTAIEQPELHVHPRLQVELGEIFVPRPDRGGIFLLESHSEHLMLRLLRRIQETTEGTLPAEARPLKTNDVSVVFVEQHDGETRLTSLPIDDTGEFTRHWPQGFFEERVHELF